MIVNLHLTDEDDRYLLSCARIRHISYTRLVHRLLKTTCADQLVLSILDDDSHPPKRMPDEKTVSRFHHWRSKEVV